MDTVAPPLAYFITFHTYGTWLPGTARGSVDLHHRLAGAPYVHHNPARELSSARRLSSPPVLLADDERSVILRTIQEVSRHRGWKLHAAHARTNHVHVVVTAELPPERVMNDFKAWATRRVVEAGLRPRGVHLWVRHGSTRYVWRAGEVAAFCEYVTEGQGCGKDWAFGAPSAC